VHIKDIQKELAYQLGPEKSEGCQTFDELSVRLSEVVREVVVEWLTSRICEHFRQTNGEKALRIESGIELSMALDAVSRFRNALLPENRVGVYPSIVPGQNDGDPIFLHFRRYA